MEEKKKSSFLQNLLGEKADRTATFGMLAAGIAYAGKKLWEKASERVLEKGAEKLEKKVEEVLGLDVEKAKHDPTDEILFLVALHGLPPDDRKKIQAFRSGLRTMDQKKAEAFVLYVARIVKMHEKTKKKFRKPPKGKSGDQVEILSKEYELTYSNDFLNDILRLETFEEKVKFLEDENVFDLIPPEKKLWKSVKEAGCRLADKVAAKTETAAKKATENLEKNSSDWIKITQSWKEKARAFRDGVKNE